MGLDGKADVVDGNAKPVVEVVGGRELGGEGAWQASKSWTVLWADAPLRQSEKSNARTGLASSATGRGGQTSV